VAARIHHQSCWNLMNVMMMTVVVELVVMDAAADALQ